MTEPFLFSGDSIQRVRHFVEEFQSKSKNVIPETPSLVRNGTFTAIKEGRLFDTLDRADDVTTPTTAKMKVFGFNAVTNTFVETGDILTVVNRDSNQAGEVNEYISVEWNGTEFSPVAGRLSSAKGPLTGRAVYVTGPGSFGYTVANGVSLVLAEPSGGTISITMPTMDSSNEGVFVTIKNVASGGIGNNVSIFQRTSLTVTTASTFGLGASRHVRSDGDTTGIGPTTTWWRA